MARKAKSTSTDTFSIHLFDGLGMHVSRDAVVWFGKKIIDTEGGSFYEGCTQRAALKKLAARKGKTITPTIGVFPAAGDSMLKATGCIP